MCDHDFQVYQITDLIRTFYHALSGQGYQVCISPDQVVPGCQNILFLHGQQVPQSLWLQWKDAPSPIIVSAWTIAQQAQFQTFQQESRVYQLLSQAKSIWTFFAEEQHCLAAAGLAPQLLRLGHDPVLEFPYAPPASSSYDCLIYGLHSRAPSPLLQQLRAHKITFALADAMTHIHRDEMIRSAKAVVYLSPAQNCWYFSPHIVQAAIYHQKPVFVCHGKTPARLAKFVSNPAQLITALKKWSSAPPHIRREIGKKQLSLFRKENLGALLQHSLERVNRV